MSQKRRYIKPNDITMISILLVLCLGFFVYKSFANKTATGGNVAVVSHNGVELERFDLQDYQSDQEVEVYFAERFGLPVSIALKDGTIRFKAVDCPDQICVNTGALKNDMDIAVCMPNKVSITVYSKEDAQKLK